jgi:hypothetical protein
MIINFSIQPCLDYFSSFSNQLAILGPINSINEVISDFWKFGRKMLVMSYDVVAGGNINNFCEESRKNLNANALLLFLHFSLEQILYTCRHGQNNGVNANGGQCLDLVQNL